MWYATILCVVERRIGGLIKCAGKSSITLRLVRSQWTHEYDPTIGKKSASLSVLRREKKRSHRAHDSNGRGLLFRDAQN